MIFKSRTILCWILSATLLWLPFTASADDGDSAMTESHCHEMNSVASGHAIIKEASEHITQAEDACCGHCDGSVNCMNITACGFSFTHIAFIIIYTQHPSGVLIAMQSLSDYMISYQGHMISPDIRPPVV